MPKLRVGEVEEGDVVVVEAICQRENFGWTWSVGFELVSVVLLARRLSRR